MNSTEAPDGLHGSVRRPTAAARGGFTLLAACLAVCLVVTPAPAEESPVSRPPQLERDVEFWIRVYTQIDTNAGFLHDQYNLSVVYDTLSFAPNTTPSEREREVDQARERYGAALRRVAEAGEAPLSADDQRVRELWGPECTPARLPSATEDIRFQ